MEKLDRKKALLKFGLAQMTSRGLKKIVNHITQGLPVLTSGKMWHKDDQNESTLMWPMVIGLPEEAQKTVISELLDVNEAWQSEGANFKHVDPGYDQVGIPYKHGIINFYIGALSEASPEYISDLCREILEERENNEK